MIDYKKRLAEYVEKTSKSKELFQILENVYNDSHNLGENHKLGAFMVILINCNDDNKRQQMIDILKKWKLSPSDMIEASLQIHDGKTPEIQKA